MEFARSMSRMSSDSEHDDKRRSTSVPDRPKSDIIEVQNSYITAYRRMNESIFMADHDQL